MSSYFQNHHLDPPLTDIYLIEDDIQSKTDSISRLTVGHEDYYFGYKLFKFLACFYQFHMNPAPERMEETCLGFISLQYGSWIIAFLQFGLNLISLIKTTLATELSSQLDVVHFLSSIFLAMCGMAASAALAIANW